MITYSPTLATAAADAKATIVTRMAERMREMGMNGQAVTKDSLFESSDFTIEEIDAFGTEAANEARRASVRQLADA